MKKVYTIGYIYEWTNENFTYSVEKNVHLFEFQSYF